MTNEELIAKQAAIIQVQEIELKNLKNIEKEFIKFQIDKSEKDQQRFIMQLETEIYFKKQIDAKNEEIAFLKDKLTKRQSSL
jgi:hypothetical protein